MAKIERLRETMKGDLDANYVRERAEAGWRVASVEWERELPGEPEPPLKAIEPIPFGLRISTDCRFLEEDPTEMQALKLLLQFVVQDISMSRMANELNDRGFRTREGDKWTAIDVFNTFPRLVDVAPRILSSEEWALNRKRLAAVAWNS